MSKLKKSVKAIIISGVTAVCVLAITLGCVFGFKKPNDPDSPVAPPPNAPVQPAPTQPVEPSVPTGLTDEQKKLVEMVNSKNEYNAIVEYVPENYCFENGNQIDFEFITRVYDNLLVYELDGKTTILVKQVKAGKTYYVDIFEFVEVEGTIEDKKIEYANDKYVHLAYIYKHADSQKYLLVNEVWDLSSISNLKIIKSYEMEVSETDTVAKVNENKISIRIEPGYIMVITQSETTSGLVDLNILDYNGESQFKLEEISSFDDLEIQDYAFYFIIQEKVYFGSSVNGNISTLTFEENVDNVYEYTINRDYMFIETATLAEEKTDVVVDNKLYSYKLINIATSEEKDIVLQEGYAKAAFASIEGGEYYYLFEQKVNSKTDELEEVGLMNCYDLEGNIVVAYEADSANDIIVYSNDSEILTKYGIFSTRLEITAELKRKFVNEEVLDSEIINEETYVVYDGTHYHIWNMNGENLFDVDFAKICAYDNGVYFAQGVSDEVYRIDVKTNAIDEIETFVSDEDKNNHTIITSGGGYYFATNEGSDTFTLFDYNNNVKFDNVKSYEFIYKRTTHVLVTLDDNKQYTFDLGIALKKVKVENDPELLAKGAQNYSQEWADDISGTNWLVSGYVDKDEEYTANYIYGANGKYVKSGEIKNNGRGIGSIVGDSYYSFTYTYSTHTFSQNDDEWYAYVLDATVVYGFDLSAGSYTYCLALLVSNEEDELKHCGKLRKAENMDTGSLYCTVYMRALKSGTDYDYANTISNYTNDSYRNTKGTTIYFDGSSVTNADLPTDANGVVGGTIAGYRGLFNYENIPTSISTYDLSTTSGSVSCSYSLLYSTPDPETYYGYAYYTHNSYSINYNYDGGSVATANPGSKNYSTAFSLNEPTKQGYLFDTWSLSDLSSCTHYAGSASNSMTSFTGTTADKDGPWFEKLEHVSGESVNFTAKWTPITYSITYNYDGGSAASGGSYPTSRSYGVAGGSDDFTVTNPVKTGYTFTGWTISGMDATTHWWGGVSNSLETATGVMAEAGYLNLTSVNNAQITFLATWRPNNYTISYNYDGGSGAKDVTYETSPAYGSWFNVVDPIKTGYTFSSWSISGMDTVSHKYNTTSSNTGQQSTSETTLTVTNAQNYVYFKNLHSTGGTVTFKANWTANTYTVSTVTNSADTANITRKSFTYNTADSIANPTKTGYTFTGWNISGMDDKSSVTGATIDHYSGTTSSNLTKFGSASTASAIFGPYFKNLRSTSGEVTLTATWSANHYSVSYDPNGGVFNSDTNNATSATYDVAFNVTTPIRHGYNFAGWTITVVDTSADNSPAAQTANYPNTRTDSFSNLTPVDGYSVRFTANWVASTHTISYLYNNPTKANDTATFTYNNIHNVANPTRMGYTFNYWNISAMSACGHTNNCDCFNSYDAGVCSHFHKGSSTTNISNMTRVTGNTLSATTSTYFANLACINDRTVIFEAFWNVKSYNIINAAASYGSECNASTNYDQWFSITAPTDHPLGYHFAGWEVSGMNETDENTGETTTYYYGTNTSSGYSSGSGDSDFSVSTEASVYYFKNLSSNLNATVTITPIWEKNEYYVTYDFNNPNIINNTDDNNFATFTEITARYDEAFYLKAAQKDGYTFLGWSLSGLSDDCDHYYGSSAAGATNMFKSDNGRYTDPNDRNIYIILNYTYFKNLRSDRESSDKAIMIANWRANTYTITYHFIPASFDVTAYSTSQLHTHVNIAQNMTSTLTQTVTYDLEYEAIIYKNFKGEVFFDLPVGLRHIVWAISPSALSGTTSVGQYDTDGTTVISALSDSIYPEEERVYGPGNDADAYNANQWEYYPQNIHMYAVYDLAGIKLRYYAPATASGENHLINYSAIAEITVKYTELITFADSDDVVDGDNLIGWMISADYFGSGELTHESLTVYTYQSSTFVAYKGNQVNWGFTNVDAYSYEDPRYHLYAIYDYDYSGSIESLWFEYVSSSNAYMVHRGSDFLSGTIRIPTYYNDGIHGFLPVKFTEENAFAGESDLTTVILPSLIYGLGEYSFSGCTGLTTMVLPETLEYIGDYAFSDCESLESIVIPASVKAIGNYAFSESGLTSVVTNEGLREIGDYAFDHCSFASFNIPSTVYAIGQHSFAFNVYLTSIAIPAGVDRINEYAFYKCSALETVTFHEESSLKRIEQYAFAFCSKIATISIPNSVRLIANHVFYRCSGLVSINMPDYMVTLGSNVFYNCIKLQSIKIPYGITSIGSSTFYNCPRLTSIKIPDSVKTIGGQAFVQCRTLSALTIPDSVEMIGTNILQGAESLEVLKIPFIGQTLTDSRNFGYLFGSTNYNNHGDVVPASLKTVIVTRATSILHHAFYGCDSIERISLPDTLTTIGVKSLEGCTALEELSIPFVGVTRTHSTYYYLGSLFGSTDKTDSSVYPESLTTVYVTSATIIPDYAFYLMTNLTAVTLNEGIVTIGQYAFSSCSLQSITFPKSLVRIDLGAFEYNALTNIEFNDGLQLIGAGAFQFSSTKNLVIPSSVQTIGICAFLDSGLETVVIMDGVTSIGQAAFQNCFSLTSIVLPNTISTLEQELFRSCMSLASIVIPDHVSSIGGFAFAECVVLNNVKLPKKLQTIGNAAFYKCSLLTTLTLPNTVTTIGASAFESSAIQNINFPAAITSIGASAFFRTALVRVDLSKTQITTLSDSVFAECVGLNTIIFSNTITTIGSSVCYGASIQYTYFCGSVSDYASLETSFISDNNSDFFTGEVVCNYDKMIYTYIGSAYSLHGTPATDGSVSGELWIPETYDDGINGRYNVTIIEDNAYLSHTSMTSVVIPRTITEIGRYAFAIATALQTFTIAGYSDDTSQLETIGAGAFNNTTALTSFSLPSGVIKINDYTFYQSGIANFYVAQGQLKYVGRYAFAESQLESAYNILWSVTYVCEYAFQSTKITKVAFNGMIDTIPEGVFNNCSSLSNVYLGSSVYYISAPTPQLSPFYGCSPALFIFSYRAGKSCGFGLYWNYVGADLKASVIFNQRYSPKVRFAFPYDYKFEQPNCYYIGGVPDSDIMFKTTNYHVASSTAGLRIIADDYTGVSFEYAVSSQWMGDYFYIYHNGTKVLDLSGSCDNYVYYSIFLSPGDTLELRYTKNASLNSNEDHVLIRNLMFSAGYSTNFYTNASGVIVSDTVNIDDSIAEIVYYPQESQRISFNYSISSEAECDKFIVLKNTTTQLNVSGIIEETAASVTVSKNQTLTLQYVKDGSLREGDDRVYITNFAIATRGLVTASNKFELEEKDGTSGTLKNTNTTIAASKGTYYYNITFTYDAIISFDLEVNTNAQNIFSIYVDHELINNFKGSCGTFEDYTIAVHSGQRVDFELVINKSVTSNTVKMSNFKIVKAFLFNYKSDNGVYYNSNHKFDNTCCYLTYTGNLAYGQSKSVQLSVTVNFEKNRDRLMVYLNGLLAYDTFGQNTSNRTFTWEVDLRNSRNYENNILVVYYKDGSVTHGDDSVEIAITEL